MQVVPPTMTAVSALNRYGSPSDWSAPAKPARSAPTSAEHTALVANTDTQTFLVLMRASAAARGFAPVAKSRRPAAVRGRTTATRTAIPPQMRTIGGTASPNVGPEADVRSVRNGGGVPLSLPWVQATVAPAAIEPMPSDTTRGWMRQRWQIQPVAAPMTAAITTIVASAPAAEKCWAP